MADERPPAMEIPGFSCECGCLWFEQKELCKVQSGSKYMAFQDFIPTERIQLIKCAYCGAYYNIDGVLVKIPDILE